MALAMRPAAAAIVAQILLLGVPTEPARSETELKPAAEDKSNDLWNRETLFGDLGGLRPWLDQHGVKLGLTETSEVLGNTTGGRHRGVIYEGLTDLNLNIDFRSTLGLPANIFAR